MDNNIPVVFGNDMTPDHVFRIAEKQAGNESGAVSKQTGYPYITDCWNLNPTSGPSTVETLSCLDITEAYENRFEIDYGYQGGHGDLFDGSHFSLCLVLSIYKWVHTRPATEGGWLFGGTSKYEWLAIAQPIT